MPYNWTEDLNNSDYKFHADFTASVSLCPECCIGGNLLSKDLVYKQSIQMTCRQGIRVFDCQDTSNNIYMLVFPCEDTQLIRNNLFENLTVTNAAATSSALPSQGTQSVTSVASPSPSVHSSASQLNVSLVFPMFIILFYLYIFNRVK